VYHKVWYTSTTKKGVSKMILLTTKGTVLTVQNIKINDKKDEVGLSITKIDLNQNQKKEVTKC
jgi:hypothetical protein